MKHFTTVGMILVMATLLVAVSLPFSAIVTAQTSLPDMIRRVKPSVAWVTVQTDQGPACGSAFAVDASGLLVTALHVVGRAQAITIQWPTNASQPATVLAVDTKNDLAILRVGTQGLTPLPIAEAVQPGQDAVVVGYPFCSGPDPTVTKGVVSGLNRIAPIGGINVIQIDAAINPGDSGGPVLTAEGNVIGMVDQARLRFGPYPTQAVNFAVPYDAIKSLVAAALDPAKPHLGLTLPLQATVSGRLHYKGSANASGKIVKDVACVSPPSGALSVSAVHGELKADSALIIKTTLTMRTNPDEPSVGEFGVLARYGPEKVQVVDQQLPEFPARDVCLSYLAQSTLPGFYGVFSLGFEVSYTVDYKVWSSEITGEPLPEPVTTPETTPAQGPPPGHAIVTWKTRPNGAQVTVALQIVVPAGNRQAVKVVSITSDGQTKTVYEAMHDAGETVSVSTVGVPPFIIQVYVGGMMVKQITVPAGS